MFGGEVGVKVNIDGLQSAGRFRELKRLDHALESIKGPVQLLVV